MTTRPLPGHPYHNKTSDQLRYIIKDAGEAARAMRDHSPAAESKYLDQVNDACTVLYYRERFPKHASQGDDRPYPPEFYVS